MKPPHWLCMNCGIIINDSGAEPKACTYCDKSGFVYAGYEDEYDIVEVRAENGILFDPSRFSEWMKEIYWKNMNASERLRHMGQIEELNARVKERMEELGTLPPGLFD